MKMSNFTKMELFERQFKRRFNRDAEIYRKLEWDNNGKLKTATAKIICGKEFLLKEYFTPEELTDFVIVSYENKNYRYNTYLEGEVHVADQIGGLDGNS